MQTQYLICTISILHFLAVNTKVINSPDIPPYARLRCPVFFNKFLFFVVFFFRLFLLPLVLSLLALVIAATVCVHLVFKPISVHL